MEYKAPKQCDSELDFSSHWTDHTVARELQRGLELREKKARPTPAPIEFKAVAVNVIKSPPMCGPSSDRKTRRRKKRHHNRALSPIYSKRASSPSNRRYRKSRQRNRNKCPLRIAELAVPTKRHCLDNWKKNAYILPEIMIERLRQHVLDERPVVALADAVQFFRNSKKKNISKEINQYKKSIKEHKGSNKKNAKPKKVNIQDMRNFCAIFGHKMSQKLIKPMNIILSSELETLACIVYNDITKLMLKDKNLNSEYLYKNRNIQIEIASKITLWIKYILDESYYAILEDQIRDLEEEAGPVLDFLDDFVENILDICIPYVETESLDTYDILSTISKSKGDSSEDDSYWDGNVPISVKSTDIRGHGKKPKTIHDYIENKLDEIIDDIVKDSRDQSPEQVSENFDADFITNDLSDDYAVKENPSEIDDEDEFVDVDNENGDIDESENNVSGNDKKVKFGNEDMVNFPNDGESGVSGEPLINLPEGQTTRNSLQSVTFSEPNEHLLSDVDEIWPSDVDPHELKPSESVSKSINSLGRIFETDEKSTQDYLNLDKLDTDILRGKEFDYTEERVESKYSFDRLHANKGSMEDGTEGVKTVGYKDVNHAKGTTTDIPVVGSKLHSTDGLSYVIMNPEMEKYYADKGIQIGSTELSTEQMKYLKDIGVNTSIDKGSKGRGHGKSGSKGKKDESDDVTVYPLDLTSSYKVQASKIPSWARSIYNEYNQPTKSKQNISRCHIKKWCADLENGCNNLDLWYEWIDITLRSVNNLHLCGPGNSNTCYARCNKSNQWMAIKKKIDDDVTVWNSAYERSRRILQSYRCFYYQELPKPKSCKCHQN